MKFVVKSNSRYFRDTREESGHGGCSNIFTSSTNLDYATQFETREAAVAWAAEFMGDFPYSVEPVPFAGLTDENVLESKHRRMLELILTENPTVSEVLDLMAEICDKRGQGLGGRATNPGCLWWGAQVHIYHAARLIEMAGL